VSVRHDLPLSSRLNPDRLPVTGAAAELLVTYEEVLSRQSRALGRT
jgi:hypothetical protein